MLDRRGIFKATLASAVAASATSVIAQPLAPKAPIADRLRAEASKHILPLSFDGDRANGPGWDLLVREGRAAEFTMVGEEHGLREYPLFVAALYAALVPAGYGPLVIETSPQSGDDLDAAALGGRSAIEAFVRKYPPGPAFYFWETEAEMLVRVRSASTMRGPVFWGVDYEISNDRRLIEQLATLAPPGARPAVAELRKGSDAAWQRWSASHDPRDLFMVGGDLGLVDEVEKAWHDPSPRAISMMRTIRETIEINRLFGKQGWASNQRRSAVIRANFVRHLNASKGAGGLKIMAKMGENHLQRGVNWTGGFDLGSLLPEIAELRGGHAFSILVGGGASATHGVLNPTNMTTAAAPVDMFEQLGLTFLTELVTGPGPSIIDLRPLRPMLGNPAALTALANPEAARNIFAYDTLLIWNGATANRMLV